MELKEGMYEEFKDIVGYEDYYEISNYGTVRSKERYSNCCYGKQRLLKEKIIVPKQDKYGYLKVGLTKDGKQKYKFVHRLVAETFIPNPENHPIVNHINGNKIDNYIDNLEWCTQQYNVKHAYKNGLKKGVSAEHKGSKNPKSKLTEKEVLLILENKKNGVHLKACYVLFKDKISLKGFEQIWYGYRWKHLVEKVDE